MTYRLLIWDLDGTLLDTLEDLASSMNRVLAQMKLPQHLSRDYRYFVGDGMEALARRVLPEEKRQQETIAFCMEAMLKEYSRNWKEKTRPYPGILETLGELQMKGMKMAILSNKPHRFTCQMVEHFFSPGLFQPVFGVGGDIPRKPDVTGVEKILQILQVKPQEAIFIGDTKTDMETAVQAGLYPLGVLWGFRPEQELLASGASSLLQKPQDLLSLLFGGDVDDAL